MLDTFSLVKEMSVVEHRLRATTEGIQILLGALKLSGFPDNFPEFGALSLRVWENQGNAPIDWALRFGQSGREGKLS